MHIKLTGQLLKSSIFILGWVLFCGLGVLPVHAQDQPPPTPIPLIEEPSSPASAPTPRPSSPAVNPPPPLLDTPPSGYLSDELLVKFDPNLDPTVAQSYLQAIQASLQSSLDEIGVSVLEIPAGTVASAVGWLRAQPGVIFAEPNYKIQALDVIPNDPDYSLQTNLVQVRAPQAWQRTRGSAGVIIAIVDSGVEYTHPDLANKLVAGYDFVNNDTVAQDDSWNGHGTHVAGIAAAISNNRLGMAGIAWQSRIMPVKVLNATLGGSYANVASGILWAVNHGARVINLSLGGTAGSVTLQSAIDEAVNRGAVVVAATGNNAAASVLYPARYPNVIAVGAVDASNQRASFSNYGPEVDVCAPGVNIYSTLRGPSFGRLSGTSMSTPHISGLAALLFSLPNNPYSADVRQQIESSALFLGNTDECGFGLIQMDAALALVPTLPPSTDSSTSEEPDSPPAAGGAQALPGNGSGGPTPTFTPTPTCTVTPLWTATASPSPTVTPTAAVPNPANPTAPPTAALPESRPPVLLAGSLISSGLLLIIAAIRLRKRS